MWHLIDYYRKPWCIQRFFRTIPPLLKVYGAWISCRLHLIAFDRLESHTPFPCPTSQAINNFPRFQCLLFILNFNHQQDPISDNVCRDINVQREHYNGCPDSSVSKIVISQLATYLCCTCLNHTSSMLAKKYQVVKKKINIKPCSMHDWFDCHLPGCNGLTVFPVCMAKNYPGFPPDQNASLEAKLLDLTSIP